MSKVNKEKIITLLNEGNKALNILKEYKNLSKPELLESYKEMSVIKYHFIIIAEAAIDICNHITSKKINQVADSYVHCFSLLIDNKIVTSALGTKLAEFAKFRNLLVHLYWKVDDSLVLDKLNELSYFDEYFTLIVKDIKA